jgi:hypothetical protein
MEWKWNLGSYEDLYKHDTNCWYTVENICYRMDTTRTYDTGEDVHVFTVTT